MVAVKTIALLAIALLPLSGCGGGSGGSPATAAATSGGDLTPTVAGLSISGSPLTAITVDTNYSFTPTATGPTGAALVFSQSNAPTWFTFNSSTGQLLGTPTSGDVGTYSNISISVNDGSESASLPPFSLTVMLTAVGTASLNWIAPTTNTDGTPIANLAGFKVKYGPDAADMTNVVTIASALTDNYVVQNLTPATWVFAVTSFTTSGAESQLSNIASKTISSQ